MLRHRTCWTQGSMGFITFLVAVVLPLRLAHAQDQPKVFYACYVPASGTVYRIKEPDTKQGCASPHHVAFSWMDGAGATDHGALQGLGDDDHPQYLKTDGTRTLTGSLGAGGHKLTGLASATENGDAVRYEQAVKSGDAAGGDLSGTYPNPSVAKLKGVEVASTTPVDGEVLTYDGANSEWKPAHQGTTPAGALTVVAAGTIDLGCVIVNKTANVTGCVQISEGVYEITINGIQYSNASYITLLTSIYPGRDLASDDYPGAGPHPLVVLATWASSSPQALDWANTGFHFVIYQAPQ